MQRTERVSLCVLQLQRATFDFAVFAIDWFGMKTPPLSIYSNVQQQEVRGWDD